MKTIAFALLALLSLAGCGKDDPLAPINDWADRACKCTDKKCADEAAMEFNKLEHEYEKQLEANSDKADAILERANKCIEALGAPGAG